MAKKQKSPEKVLQHLLDKDKPLMQRRHLLMSVVMDSSDAGDQILNDLFTLASSSPEAAELGLQKKQEELDALLKQFEEGPYRPATFVRMLTGPGLTHRCEVALEDGATAFVTVSDESLRSSLRRGEQVLLEGQAKALLHRGGGVPNSGETARFERDLKDGRIEVVIHDHERFVLRTSDIIQSKLDSEELDTGASLTVCPRQRFAFDALPVEEGYSRYRYLDRSRVPDIVVDRDIASPPPFIAELDQIVRTEMSDPETRRRYHLPGCTTRLLRGVSGSGKTYTIGAAIRRVYDTVSEVTGAPLAEIPHRVLRLRTAEVLSKWLGDSDRNLDRFFDEVEQLAAEPFVGPDGIEHQLPVIAILEEIDGLARERGDEPVYDRILTTMLQRLDPARPELRDKLVLFLATTNVAHQVDHAFLRRIGGKVVEFGRLDRRAFCGVLEKRLEGQPLEVHGPDDGNNDNDGSDSGSNDLDRVVAEVAGWLFRPKSADQTQIEVTLAGSTAATPYFRKDLLTASLVAMAVQNAAEAACRNELVGENGGLSSAIVIDALREQVSAVLEQIHATNAHNYLDLPDGARVATVRRIPEPAIDPQQLIHVA